MNLDYKTNFTHPLMAWYNRHGRKNLPWQNPRNPYKVWISEIMLQQTQVKTTIPYFEKFITRFPDIASLAAAELDEVLSHWAGLGYYRRAHHLHQAAKILQKEYLGIFPKDAQQILALPGIGRTTAAAIASLAFDQPLAIMDGNVKRVLSRYFLATTNHQLWDLAQACMATTQCGDYTQAIMDLGALCCTSKNPQCQQCPLHKHCKAYQQNIVQDYPQKKPKKNLPTQQQHFLVLYNPYQQKIFLEKRPPVGIWGGLWCLPGITWEEEPAAYLLEHYGFIFQDIQPLIRFKHSFSHYHLDIQSSALAVKTQNHCLKETSGRWFDHEELKKIGTAQPIQTIINAFFHDKLTFKPRTSLEG